MPVAKEVKFLIHKAQDHYLYFDESDGDNKRYFEAFLVQSITLEGVVKELAKLLIGQNFDGHKEILEKREGQIYNFSTAIDDLYLTESISSEEFKKLDNYRKKRNQYNHRLLSERGGIKNLNEDFRGLYDDVQPLLVSFSERLSA